MVHLFFVGIVITSFFKVLGMVLQGVSLGSQFGMRTKNIKVYTLTDERAPPKCIKIMKGEDGKSLANLKSAPRIKED